MFLGYQGEKIKFYTEQQLDVSAYNLDKIEETDDEYVLSTDRTEYVLKTQEWEDEQAEIRQKEFYQKFMLTSLGNYRLEPKGYANAQQSFDVIDKQVSKRGALTQDIAQLVIFYSTPNFYNAEECTEEWLLQHQTNIQPMSKSEWDELYDEFSTLYMQKMYIAQQNTQQV